MKPYYERTHVCRQSGARLGVLKTRRGDIPTPVFMPVGTQATVKTLDVHEAMKSSEGLILANAYHLWVQPGVDIIEAHGGLHNFMRWEGALLTDSGGFQVHSMSDIRSIDEDGVHFRHHKSGAKLLMTPETSIAVQAGLGSDIAMSFDECAPFDADYDYMKKSVERTLRWAKRGRDVNRPPHQALYGIVQGGPYADLRRFSLEQTHSLGFDGIAIGGLSVGESKKEMYRVLDDLKPHLPASLPRYLMGVGTPDDLLEAIGRGIDMFDCVHPTRLARHGGAYTEDGPIAIKNKGFEADMSPIDQTCDCPVCTAYTRSHIRHLLKAQETLGHRLVSVHNLHFMKKLLRRSREAISNDVFDDFKQAFLKKFYAKQT